MIKPEFESHSAPFGEAIPSNTPHAVSVSLPTIRDVSRVFSDRDPIALAGLQTIYPRFGDHPFVQQAMQHVDTGMDRQVMALSSPEAGERLIRYLPNSVFPNADIIVDDGMTFMTYGQTDAEAAAEASLARTITGWVPSSRLAEDYLFRKGDLSARHPEKYGQQGITSIERALSFISPERPEVILANSGMSAMTAVVSSLFEIRNQGVKADEPRRDIWVVLGGAYHDTEELTGGNAQRDWRSRTVAGSNDLKRLSEIIAKYGDRIVGVITEAPTNPLLDVPDLAGTKELLGEIPLIVDVSTAGSITVNALPEADVVIESLTKTASGGGDVMMGAVMLNTQSCVYEELRQMVPTLVDKPYIRDVQRLGYQMSSWPQRVAQSSMNTEILAEFFEGQKRVNQIFWTGNGRSAEAYKRLMRKGLVHAGVITAEIKRSLSPVYDRLDLSKGPSFGTNFSLITPYVHITQADQMAARNSESRQTFMNALKKRTGLTPRMMRISVGTEDPGWLIERFDRALTDRP